MKKKWIPVRKSHLMYYNELELFYRAPSGDILLYKPAGMSFSDKSLERKIFIDQFYIKEEDRHRSIELAQKGFNHNLLSHIREKDITEIKSSLVSIVDETLTEPRGGGLGELPQTVNLLVEGYSTQPEILKAFARISFKDYTTAIHSINVMALTMRYCFFTMRTMEETSRFGLAALLHDVGKTEIKNSILTARRKLTDEEFLEMKAHTLKGREILNLYEGALSESAVGCMEHHEKLDGSGYPDGKKDISELGQLLGIVDCYEAITNDDRPYRTSMKPISALELLKKDVAQNKYNPRIFRDFAYSLTDRNHR